MDKKPSKDYSKYIADSFAQRLNDLGITRYRFLRNNPGANQATLDRMLYGRGGTSFNTVAYYADMLGLELVFKLKEQNDETESKQENLG